MVDAQTVGKVIGEYLRSRLMIELREQGHNLSGALVGSIAHQVQVQANSISIRFEANDYGLIVNSGVPAERIPYTPGRRSGAKTSRYIQALISYAQRRMGLVGREATSAAFAIARKHAREGMPTRGSYRYSSNGRRTGWIDQIVDQEPEFIEKTVTEWVEHEITILIQKAVK